MAGLHQFLAILCGLAIVSVVGEAVWRVVRNAAPSPTSGRLSSLALILLGVTSASGLGIMAGGARPQQLWHLMYGGFAFTALPIANSFATRAKPRGRALATVIGAAFVLVVIARLFATG